MELDNYIIKKGKIQEVHELIKDFHNNLFSNEHMQEVLFRNTSLSYNKPNSYHSIKSAVILREQTKIHLQYLEYSIDLAIKPGIIEVNFDIGKLTGEHLIDGYPREIIESLQKGWFENLNTVEIIRKYQKNLNDAFNSFNMQFILSILNRAPYGLFFDCENCKELGDKVNLLLDRAEFRNEEVNPLESVYYNNAVRNFRIAGTYWQQLDKDSYGRNFRLKIEEVMGGLKNK